MSDSTLVEKVLLDQNGVQISIDTAYVERDVQITRRMKVPLYRGGQLKSAEELAQVGITLLQFRGDQLKKRVLKRIMNDAYFVSMYSTYKGQLDKLGFPYTVTEQDIPEQNTALLGLYRQLAEYAAPVLPQDIDRLSKELE